MGAGLIILRSQYGHRSDYSEVTVWTRVYQRLCQTVDCKPTEIIKIIFLKVVNIVFKLERAGGGKGGK